MALGDVTAAGVQRAMAEFDRLGRQTFLARYGFGQARGYFLIHEGRRYDSKAIAGVAHGYDRSDLGPLRSQDFTGGEATVAPHLESLGFEVEWPSRNPPWAEEELILALDLYLREGLLNDEDRSAVDLSRDLNALTVHAERPDAARLRSPSAVALKLANIAALDPNHPGRGMRHVGRRDSEVWDRYASDEDTLAEAAAAIREGSELPTLPTPERGRRRAVEAEVESQHVDSFQVCVPEQTIEAGRREQALVLAYRDHLVSQGHRVTRRLYPLPGSRSQLACDLIDETEQVLYEAKGNTRRSSVRMAIGQLFDYRRFEQTPMRIAILLPREPAKDLVELIHSARASAVWRTTSGFSISHP